MGRIVFPHSRGIFTSNILVRSQYRLASSIKCPLLFTVWTSVLRHFWLHSSRSLVFPDLENEPDLLRLWIPFLKEIILTPPKKYYFLNSTCFSSPKMLFSFPFLICLTLNHRRFQNNFLVPKLTQVYIKIVNGSHTILFKPPRQLLYMHGYCSWLKVLTTCLISSIRSTGVGISISSKSLGISTDLVQSQ